MTTIKLQSINPNDLYNETFEKLYGNNHIIEDLAYLFESVVDYKTMMSNRIRSMEQNSFDRTLLMGKLQRVEQAEENLKDLILFVRHATHMTGI